MDAASTNNPDFIQSAEDIRKINTLPDNDELLSLYSLFKQGVVGDCNTEKPGVFDLKGKAKWEAWQKLKGMSKEEAQSKYIETAKSLKAKYA